jgi:hypothetical protein
MHLFELVGTQENVKFSQDGEKIIEGKDGH